MFREILHPPDADPAQVNPDKGLLNTRFPLLIPFDNRYFKRQRPQTEHQQGNLPGLTLEFALATARSGVHTVRFHSYSLAPQSL